MDFSVPKWQSQNMNATHKPAPDDWFIAVFPDGTWCHWRERWGIQHRYRGDYECREVLTFHSGTGEPVESVLRPPPDELRKPLRLDFGN